MHYAIPGEQTHPANSMLAGFAAAQSTQAHAVQLAEYRELLRTMDWHHQFGSWESHQAGLRQIRRIRELQPYVDADAALFNAARPQQHGSATL